MQWGSLRSGPKRIWLAGAIGVAVFAVVILPEQRAVARELGSGQAHSWTLNSSATCDERRAIIDRMAAETRVELKESGEVRAGASLSMHWSRGSFAEREPVYLMIAFDGPVRFKGEGFYGLLPNARAAFDIPWADDETRAVIPYYGRGVPKQGAFEIVPVQTGPLRMRWSVLGFDGCAAHIGNENTLAQVQVRASLAQVDKMEPLSTRMQHEGSWACDNGVKKLNITFRKDEYRTGNSGRYTQILSVRNSDGYWNLVDENGDKIGFQFVPLEVETLSIHVPKHGVNGNIFCQRASLVENEVIFTDSEKSNSSDVIARRSTHGVPEIVVVDPFSFDKPEVTYVNADGTRHIDVYVGRWRLLDVETGAEITERVGGEPRFSPTGRWVFDNTGNYFDALDGAIAGQHAAVARYGETVGGTNGLGLIGWSNADSILVGRSWGPYEGVFIADGLSNRRLENQGFMPRSGKAQWGWLDLENNVIIVEDYSGHSYYHASVLTTNRNSGIELGRFGSQRLLARNVLTDFVRREVGVTSVRVEDAWDAGFVFSGKEEDAGANDGSPRSWYQSIIEPRSSNIDRSVSTQAVALRQNVETPSNISQGLIVSRLSGLDVEFAEPLVIERIDPPRKKDPRHPFDDELTSDKAQQVIKPTYDRLFEEIGLQRIEPYDPVVGASCVGGWTDPNERTFDQGGLPSYFHRAWRWENDGVVYWMTTTRCAQGQALFNDPLTAIYSSKRGNDRIELDMSGSSSGPSCGYSLNSCEFDISVVGDQLTVSAPEAQGYGVFDLMTGSTVMKTFDVERASLISDTLLTSDGRHAALIQSDGSFAITRLSDGIVVLNGRYVDDEVVVWTPDGRFDATAEGAHFVSFRFPGRVGLYAFEQFDAVLRVPGLAAKVLAGEYEPAGNAPIGIAPPPVVEATVAAENAAAVEVTANARAERPLLKLDIFQDGLLTNSLAPNEAGIEADWSARVERLPGTRWMSLVATDEAGVASLPVGRDLGPDPNGSRRLHVLSVGINDYADPRIENLYVAEADATAFATAMDEAAAGTGDLELASRTTLLSDEATSDRVLDKLSAIVSSAKVGETIAVSFAGHGFEVDGRFYLATIGTILEDPERTALRWTDVAEVFSEAKARVVLFIDACQSGMAGRDYFASNDAAAESVLDRVPSGLVVFSAAKGREYAGEADSLGNGFFTAAIVDAIAADRAVTDTNGNGAIEISELFDRVKREVVTHTRDTESPQTPWLARNQMIGDFALF